MQFLRLRDKYKSDIFEDSRLNKAAGLAAKKELLLNSLAPATWKEPRLKAVNRELQQWVKKIRQPGGTRGIGQDVSDSDEEGDNLAVAPFHRFMGNVAKLSKGIKRKAEPIPPQLQTPVIKQRLSTSKKPKFKTGSKAKRWLPKTPKSEWTTSKKVKTPSPTSSVFSTAEEGTTAYGDSLEGEGDSIFGEEDTFTTGTEVPVESPLQQSLEHFKQSLEKKKEFSEKLKRARERALKKLAPAPGWKPFGTPAKRRLDGKDW